MCLLAYTIIMFVILSVVIYRTVSLWKLYNNNVDCDEYRGVPGVNGCQLWRTERSISYSTGGQWSQLLL